MALLPVLAGCAGITPLHRAAQHGDAAEIERLLAKGANVNAADAAHQTPMVYAAASGSVAAIKALVSRGAQVRELALWYAAAGGHLEAARYLLELGCNPEWSYGGKTALQRAEEAGHAGVAMLLRAKIAERVSGAARPAPVAANPAVEKLPPLHKAAETGDAAAIRILLSRSGAQPDALDFDGLTALSRACYQGHVEAAKALIEGGASLGAVNANKSNALHMAANGGKTETVALLLDQGMPIYLTDGRGAAALAWAASAGRKEAAEMLLARGADVAAASDDGTTALHTAAAANKAEIIALLLRYGAKVEAEDRSGATPATNAVLSQAWGAVEALRRAGAVIPEGLGKVGMGLAEKDGLIVVSQVGGAAQRAGLRVDDKLVEINGLPTPGLSVPEVIRRARGPAGGMVNVSVRRSGQVISFSIVRDAIEYPAAPQTAAAAPAPAAPRPQGLPASPAPGARRAPDESRFALVVGIEQYDSLPSASYAARDAKAVREHFEALGVPPRNLIYLENAKAGRSSLEKYLSEWLPRNVKEGGEVYFYFSGHGAPDPVSGEAYLVPWDGDPSYLKSTAIPLKDLYGALGRLKAKRVIVALDACFSGAGGRSVLAKGARPLVAKTQAVDAPEKLTVLAASSGEEISGALEERGHGMFTYFFLKGLSEGKRSSRELYDYLKPRVQDEARRQNREQTPVLLGADTEL